MNDNYFIIRMNDRRVFLFKGKNVYEEAIKRKGKIRMTLWFDDNEEYVSHTKVTLPRNKKVYELVFCYELSEERLLILLTNREIHSKEDCNKSSKIVFFKMAYRRIF